MTTIDECVRWVQHFRDLGADIGDIKINYMGWKFAIGVWEAEPYNKIAQAFRVQELKINYDHELFFRTQNVPKGDPNLEWSIRLSESQVKFFIEKYGQYYRISSL